MKNKKRTNKALMSFGIFGIFALLAMSTVFAYQGDYSIQGPDYSEERHEAMQEAFDNLDYDAWVALMSETGRSPRILTVVTEENFATFVEANEAGKAGDIDRAAELRAELGLNNGVGPKDGTGFGNRKGMRQGSRQGSMNGSGIRDQTNCIYN